MAVKVCEYRVPTDPAGSVALVVIEMTLVPLTVMAVRKIAPCPRASIAPMVMVNVPGLTGVPVTIPVFGSITSPSGFEPGPKLHWYYAFP